MCLKYILQETADCVTRQREAAMTPNHHVFLVDFDSRVCICLTGDPRLLRKDTSASLSSQTPMVPPSRPSLRTRLTSCMKEPLGGDRCQDAGARLMTDKLCVKQKTSMEPQPKTARSRGPTLQKVENRSLQHSLTRWIRKLVSCVLGK
ncbi:hypothetical protein GDO78_015156 [Eleutherodactylus coqui]|uniref:Uncharacterized protein n=1 Tax=Eleutherodactylus coqui TaxID=57060 RepID=A0A8J6B7B5_ELECQ|nr:hypothetical protein GDO78_015156 [Eleutherodactylus coqui]